MERSAPRLNGLLESCLYVDDLPRALAFYEGVLGLRRIAGDERRFIALAVSENQLLLLFVRGATTEPLVTPGGTIPPHEGTGVQHLAFAVAADTLGEWESRLERAGVAVESRVEWPRGGRSIYFRDPAGHVLELATPGLWSVY